MVSTLFFICRRAYGISVFSASTAAVIMRCLTVGRGGASEPRYRESNGSEKITGVILSSAGTFLVGYTVISSLNEKLGGSDYPDHRENAKGYVYRGASARGTKLAIKNSVDNVRKLMTLTTASTATSTLLDLRAENDRLNSLYDRSGVIIAHGIVCADIAIVIIGARGVRGHVSFTAVQNHGLLERGDALEGLASAYTETRLELEEDVISDVNLIESVVKRNLVDTNVCPKDFRALSLDVGRGSQNFLSKGGKIYARILEAISIAATVEHSLSVDAHGSARVLITAEGSVSVFLHCNFSSFKVRKAHSTIRIWSVI